MIHKNPSLISSLLIFPAIETRFFDKILTLQGNKKPDGVIFDLEDSVDDKTKDKARKNLLEYLVHDNTYLKQIFTKYIISIRINSFKSSEFQKDIEAIAKIKPHLLILSKVESEKEIQFLRKALGKIQTCALIETIKGYENRDKIIKELNPYDMIWMGYEDLSSELMIERPEKLNSNHPINLILMSCIISAKKHNIIVIDGISRKYGSQTNLSHLEEESRYTRSIGLTSKVAIHPSQIEIINKIFDKKSLVKKSNKILREFNKLKNGTLVISTVDKHMLDKPVKRMYEKIMENFNRSF